MRHYLIEIIETPLAISPRAGLKAYDFVADSMKRSVAVSISFQGITDCTSAFCNSFLGKLYMDFDPKQVDGMLELTDLDENDIWKKKLYNAQLLGSNENFRAVRKANLDELLHF